MGHSFVTSLAMGYRNASRSRFMHFLWTRRKEVMNTRTCGSRHGLKRIIHTMYRENRNAAAQQRVARRWNLENTEKQAFFMTRGPQAMSRAPAEWRPSRTCRTARLLRRRGPKQLLRVGRRRKFLSLVNCPAGYTY